MGKVFMYDDDDDDSITIVFLMFLAGNYKAFKKR